jgi:hypothetical protein
MPERAQVKSVDAIELFRASLIVFMSKVRADVEEVSGEVQRTQAWLENDRRTYWENEYRRRKRALEEAQQLLFSAKISRIQTQTAAQVLAVERAKRAVQQAEDKREAVKRWAREFGNRAQPLVKQVDQLLTFVSTDLSKATARLGAIVRTLDAYASVGPGLEQSPLPAAVSTSEAHDSAPLAPPPGRAEEEGGG